MRKWFFAFLLAFALPGPARTQEVQWGDPAVAPPAVWSLASDAKAKWPGYNAKHRVLVLSVANSTYQKLAFTDPGRIQSEITENDISAAREVLGPDPAVQLAAKLAQAHGEFRLKDHQKLMERANQSVAELGASSKLDRLDEGAVPAPVAESRLTQAGRSFNQEAEALSKHGVADGSARFGLHMAAVASLAAGKAVDKAPEWAAGFGDFSMRFARGDPSANAEAVGGAWHLASGFVVGVYEGAVDAKDSWAAYAQDPSSYQLLDAGAKTGIAAAGIIPGARLAARAATGLIKSAGKTAIKEAVQSGAKQAASRSAEFGVTELTMFGEPSKQAFEDLVRGISEKEKAALRARAPKINQDLKNVSDPNSLASALKESVPEGDRDAVFSRVLEYQSIVVSNKFITKKISKLQDWVKSPADVLYAYDDLLAAGDQDLLAAFEKKFPEQTRLVKAGYIRGPPFLEPQKVAIPDAVGSAHASLEFPTVAEAFRFARQADVHKIASVRDGVQLQFPQPEGLVQVTVDSPENAAKLVSRVESAGNRLKLKAGPIPSERFVRGDGGKPITFGFEAEMNLTENPRVLEDYVPVGIKADDWVKMSADEKMNAAMDVQSRLPSTKGTDFLKKLPSAQKDLPEMLALEGDGNFEINGQVFNSFDKVRERMDFLFDRYGPSSLQGHVVSANNRAVQGMAGYVIFEGDLAQLSTLERNFARYEANPKVIPGKNLTHHSLGPLGESDRQTLLEMEESAVKGRRVGNPGSTRVTNSPVFRGDKYPEGSVGNEFRQFHKRKDELVSAMDEFSGQLHESGVLTMFDPFSQIKLIEKDMPKTRAAELGVKIDAASWNNFFYQAGRTMRAPFPGLMYGGADPSTRFFFPLRDWKNHPVLKDLPEAERKAVQSRIDNATKKFIMDVNGIIRNTTWISPETMKDLQVAAAQWGSEANLSQYFTDFKKQHLGAAAADAPPALDKLPFVRSIEMRPLSMRDVFPPVHRSFPNGRSYEEYKLPKNLDSQNPAYLNFLKSTVEIFYQDFQPHGHITLRVGTRLYGFQTVSATKRVDFNPTAVRRGRKGYVFNVAPADIKKVQSELEQLYSNSSAQNVPPFDAYSPKLEIIKNSDGSLQYKSGSKDFANNGRVSAKIVGRDGKSYLQTEDGFLYPVTKEESGFCAQSLSCSTSATYVLHHYFGIDIDFNHSARSLRDALSRGNPGGRAPDAVIKY